MEAFGEFVTVALVSIYTLFLGLLGLSAISLGLSSLVRLARRRNLAGHGWAITGMCTGPLPMAVGCAMVLAAGVELIGMETTVVHVPTATAAPVSVCTDAGSIGKCDPYTTPNPGYLVPAGAYASTPALSPSPHGTPALAPMTLPPAANPATAPVPIAPSQLPADPQPATRSTPPEVASLPAIPPNTLPGATPALPDVKPNLSEAKSEVSDKPAAAAE